MDAAKYTSDPKAVLAAGALAAALVTPVAATPAGSVTAARDLALVSAGDSLLNIPLNLFQVIANIPSTELGAMTVLGNSLIYSGNWWSPSATNIWGGSG